MRTVKITYKDIGAIVRVRHGKTCFRAAIEREPVGDFVEVYNLISRKVYWIKTDRILKRVKYKRIN